MAKGIKVLTNRYYDSVFLMRVAQRISDEDGVVQAAVLMATENNKRILSEIGFTGTQIDDAGSYDLVLAVETTAQALLTKILGDSESWLVRPAAKTDLRPTETFAEALTRQPHSNLVVISVPGQYAAHEAANALSEGKNIFLFSSNVSVEDEVRLKRRAQQQGLLLMGPDCGTAIVSGIGIGFANTVRRGSIGAIGVAGTGLQEFTSLVHRCGAGISHALGTGGRDLSDTVGGATTTAALRLLEEDADTHVIALIAKPGGRKTLQALIPRLSAASKPVVACLLGAGSFEDRSEHALRYATTIDEAVQVAVELDGVGSADGLWIPEDELTRLAEKERAAMSSRQRFVRGIFAGGTLCYQAQTVMRRHGFTAYSNTPLEDKLQLDDPQRSREHTLVDMGDESYTRTRPHPMIDATYRKQRVLDEAADPQTAILLLDFVLGYNAAPNPVGDLLPAIRNARASVKEEGGYLSIIASVCGTQEDAQDMTAQEEMLREAGVVVLPTNAQASELAARIVVSLVERAP